MTSVDPVTVDPQGLVAAMEAAGFLPIGGREGTYARMQWPAGGLMHHWVLVPLDKSAGDFADLMDAALAELTLVATSGRVAGEVLAAVSAAGRA